MDNNKKSSQVKLIEGELSNKNVFYNYCRNILYYWKMN